MKSGDNMSLTDLMNAVSCGRVQLPDFQRGWVWDDSRIRALISSVIHGYPIGAVMLLEYGNDNIRFKYKPINGAEASSNTVPDRLVLDGQQRTTALFNALYNKEPVHTKTETGKEIDRFYYINIDKAIDREADNDEIIVSVPATKKITSDFGRKIDIDLSAEENEFEQKMFPLNIILNPTEQQQWQNKYYRYYSHDAAIEESYTEFFTKVVTPVQRYAIPIILLDKNTSKEAVCQVFENVNTGGVSLTVFELVTAIFAMDDFALREDWEERRKQYFSSELLKAVTATDFLTALTLLSSFESNRTVSCKKKDVLELSLLDYKQYADILCEGFSAVDKLLQEERIFSRRDLPYSTQLIPFAAISAVLIKKGVIKTAITRDKIKQWYWCGVFGELYGSASETRYVNDIVQVVRWIADNGELPKTVTDFFFNPTRLLSLQSRQSAAYKGMMALILKNHARDFISGEEIDFTKYYSEKIDIHHIFPKDYCIKQGYNEQKWNSIVNKTPLSASSNREIGGVAPSKYLSRLEKKGSVQSAALDSYIGTHLINPDALRSDDFQGFIIERAKKLLLAIENVTGRVIPGKDSEEVQKAFGAALG